MRNPCFLILLSFALASFISLQGCGEEKGSGCTLHRDCSSKYICKDGSCVDAANPSESEKGDVAIFVYWPRGISDVINRLSAVVFHPENSDGTKLDCKDLYTNKWNSDVKNLGPSPFKKVDEFNQEILNCGASCDGTELRIPYVMKGKYYVYIRGFAKKDAGKSYSLLAHICLPFEVKGEVLKGDVDKEVEMLEYKN